MKSTLTKSFEFSASYSDGSKVFGHNYVLRATFVASDFSEEAGLAEKIDSALIQKIHSRDFGLHVDFLKNTPPNDPARLKVFWEKITQAVQPLRLHSLCLERDRKTRWTLNAD